MEKEKTCGNEIETDFGTRSLNKQNKNRTIVIPRVCLENLGSKLDKMKISLVQATNGKKFIKLENPDSEKVENTVDMENTDE